MICKDLITPDCEPLNLGFRYENILGVLVSTRMHQGEVRLVHHMDEENSAAGWGKEH